MSDEETLGRIFAKLDEMRADHSELKGEHNVLRQQFLDHSKTCSEKYISLEKSNASIATKVDSVNNSIVGLSNDVKDKREALLWKFIFGLGALVMTMAAVLLSIIFFFKGISV